MNDAKPGRRDDPDPYRVLGVSPDASAEEIRTAFRKAIRMRHPDTSAGSGDIAGVHSLINAYQTLGDPGKRSRYDGARAPKSARAGVGEDTHRIEERPRPARRPRRCAQCSGTGYVIAVARCPSCGGRAEITVVEWRRASVRECRACRGRGHAVVETRCPACGGTGATRSRT